MSGLTEKLLCSFSALPQGQVSAQGARLLHEVWSRAPKSAARKSFQHGPGGAGELAATDAVSGTLPVETAVFYNALRFAERHNEWVSQGAVTTHLPFLGVPVFAATALAEARGVECGCLFRAVGLGMEAYARLTCSLASGATSNGFDARVISAALAAIVACASVENLPSDKAAQAIGLGSSAVTGNATGCVPLQLATAARDGIVMVLLMSCDFRGPPDALACRWGVHEVFAGSKDIVSLDIDSPNASAAACLQRIFGTPALSEESPPCTLASASVRAFLEEILR